MADTPANDNWNEYEQLDLTYIKQKAEKKMELEHFIYVNLQFSNGWIQKCSCGELFTGKGTTDPIVTRKHLIEVKEPVKVSHGID